MFYLCTYIVYFSFSIDGVELALGASVHLIKNQTSGNYTLIAIEGNATISGVYVQVYYEVESGTWSIFLNYSSTYFEVNATLLHQDSNCSNSPSPQYSGNGAAIGHIGNMSDATFAINAAYYPCDYPFYAINGTGGAFDIYGLEIIRPYFAVNIFNGSIIDNSTASTYLNGMFVRNFYPPDIWLLL